MLRQRLSVEQLEARAVPSATQPALVLPPSNMYQSWDPANGALHQFYVENATWHYQTQAAPSVWVDRAVSAEQQTTLDAVYAQNGGLLGVFASLHIIADAPPAPAATTIDVVLSDQVQVVAPAADKVVKILPAPLPIVPAPVVINVTPEQAFQQTVRDIADFIVVTQQDTYATVAPRYPIFAEIASDALTAAILLKQSEQQ